MFIVICCAYSSSKSVRAVRPHGAVVLAAGKSGQVLGVVALAEGYLWDIQGDKASRDSFGG